MSDKTTQLVIQKDGMSVTLFKRDEDILCFLKALFEVNSQVNYPKVDWTLPPSGPSKTL